METTHYKKYYWLAATLALLGVAFAGLAMGLKDFSERAHPNGQYATITVSGEGEVTALPDIATVTFTVRESGKTVPEAQKAVEAKLTKALDDISSLKVDKKDTKTVSYQVNPKYETQSTYCTAYVCPQAKTTVVGYEVTETISVKVRKIDTAGDVIGAIGKANITEINGPEFTVDNMDKAQADAKAVAIKKAQEKAKVTAKALGVTLGEITQFSEDNGGYYPVMYAASSMMAKGAEDSRVSLPQGESVIKSRVTMTYSLK